MSRMLRFTGIMTLSLLLVTLTTAMSQEKKQPTIQRPSPDSIYQLGPDSKKQPDVPEGKRSDKLTLKGKVYPDTERDYWYYLPPNMDKSKPAKVMVFQDGWNYCNPKGQAQLGFVFDNLIHKKEIPPMVGVFVNPGVPLDSDGTRITDRNKINAQRSLEYDTLSPRYAEFLEKDLLPRIEKDTGIKFSTDPNDRAICGLSSGGICAFTVAWERPDLFRKVLSHIGSFTNIKGGHVYPAQIRKSAQSPKPIRVFLQDGSNDLDNGAGNWPLANQEMAAALKFGKYDYRFEYGQGTHSLAHGGAIMPESLKWLWRDEAKK
ncbi:MAG TPA: alpha/beta hydrolase-fold protein [Gemmatales bacterium]|nr:alpha/beta hydrolase-fold protein [Gemmatales bacterium]